MLRAAEMAAMASAGDGGRGTLCNVEDLPEYYNFGLLDLERVGSLVFILVDVIGILAAFGLCYIKRKKRMQDNEGYKEFEVSDEFDDFEKELWKQFQFQPSALPVSTLRKLVKWSGSPLDYDDLVAIGGEDFRKKGGFATFIHASRLGYMNKWSGSMGF